MSTLLASASPRPFVISGTADEMPPVPVPVPTPAAVLLNHNSSVKVADPSPGAAPNVTYWLVPLNWSALPALWAWTADERWNTRKRTAATTAAPAMEERMRVIWGVLAGNEGTTRTGPQPRMAAG